MRGNEEILWPPNGKTSAFDEASSADAAPRRPGQPVPVNPPRRASCPSEPHDGPVEVAALAFDVEIPLPKRADWLRARMKDLYVFRVNGLTVSLSYNDGAPPLSETFERWLRGQMADTGGYPDSGLQM